LGERAYIGPGNAEKFQADEDKEKRERVKKLERQMDSKHDRTEAEEELMKERSKPEKKEEREERDRESI